MRNAGRLVAVVGLIAAQVACIHAETRVTLAADGSGAVSSRMIILDAVLDVLRSAGKGDPEQALAGKLPSSPTPEQAGTLAEAGVQLTRLDSGPADGGYGWAVDYTFVRPGALDAVEEAGLGGAPGLRVVDLGGGLYEARLQERAEGAQAGEAMAGGEDDGKKKSKKQIKKDMEMLGRLMGTVSDLQLDYAIEVPGAIVSISPEDGVISGQTATWRVTGAMMMAAFGDPAAASMDRREMAVRFQLPEGSSLPAAALARPD